VDSRKSSRVAAQSMSAGTGGDTFPEDIEPTQPASSVRTLQTSAPALEASATYVGPTHVRRQQEKTSATDTQQKRYMLIQILMK